MGAQNSRQVQLLGLDTKTSGSAGHGSRSGGRRVLSRRASTGALLTRQERLEHATANRASVGAPSARSTLGGQPPLSRTSQGRPVVRQQHHGSSGSVGRVTKSSTLSAASSVGCLLSTQDLLGSAAQRPVDSEVSNSFETPSSDTTNLPVSRSQSGEARPPAKLPLGKRNSKSLSARIAPTLKKFAKRSSRTLGSNSASSVQEATSKLSGSEVVSCDFLSVQRQQGQEQTSNQQQQHHQYLQPPRPSYANAQDGDLGQIERLIEWNSGGGGSSKALRKSWFTEERNMSSSSSTDASNGENKAKSNADATSAVFLERDHPEARADSVADIRQPLAGQEQRSVSLGSRQCRRAGSVGSLLSNSASVTTVNTGSSSSTSGSSCALLSAPSNPGSTGNGCIQELISSASTAISSLSLTNNPAPPPVPLRQQQQQQHQQQQHQQQQHQQQQYQQQQYQQQQQHRPSSQASQHAYGSVVTNDSRRRSSTSSLAPPLAAASTSSLAAASVSSLQAYQPSFSVPTGGGAYASESGSGGSSSVYSRQSSLHCGGSGSGAFTPQSAVSLPSGRSSRSQSRSSSSSGGGSSSSGGRYSSPSCSPPLTRAPTKLELLLGFSRAAAARCPPGADVRYEQVEMWVRGADRALIKSGWQEQPFLCAGNLVLIYGIFLIAMESEPVRTPADLRGIVMTCLYIAFTYGGHEISYPLKPFLYTEDRTLFWDRCVRLALSSSSLMLQVNKREPLYHELLISLHEQLYTT